MHYLPLTHNYVWSALTLDKKFGIGDFVEISSKLVEFMSLLAFVVDFDSSQFLSPALCSCSYGAHIGNIMDTASIQDIVKWSSLSELYQALQAPCSAASCQKKSVKKIHKVL